METIPNRRRNISFVLGNMDSAMMVEIISGFW